jgi:hypothetical protein
VLQALAGELSWVVRDLAARKFHNQKLAAASHEVKNTLQVILGNAALLRQKLKDASSPGDRYLDAIEGGVDLIIERMRVFPGMMTSPTAEAVGDAVIELPTALTQTLAAGRRAAQQRGVVVEVVYVPDAARCSTPISERARQFLAELLDSVTSATRSETVRLTVQRRDDLIELIVQGLNSNHIAEKLNALFETASRSEGARDRKEAAPSRMREYLDDVGGDVYLQGRSGEAARFAIRLPVESGAQAATAIT